MGAGADGARLDGGIPPHCRNHRVPTAGATPAIAAASSLVCPCAIAFQNGHRSARCSTGGLPGDRSLGRNDRFDLNVFCFINTSSWDVLRRRVEFTQYAANDYRKKLKTRGITVSMSRKGDCWDNAPMESVNGTLKVECVHDAHFRTREQARRAIVEYIGYYNTERRHSSMGYIAPAEFERRWRAESQPRKKAPGQ